LLYVVSHPLRFTRNKDNRLYRGLKVF